MGSRNEVFMVKVEIGQPGLRKEPRGNAPMCGDLSCLIYTIDDQVIASGR